MRNLTRNKESEKGVDIQKSEKVFYHIRLSSLSLLNHLSEEYSMTRLPMQVKVTVSLKICLETDQPLQNSPYEIFVKSRVRPIILCIDIQKAFWQI